MSFRALPLTECRQAGCPCASSSLGLPSLKCRRELLILRKSLLPARKQFVADGRLVLPCSFVGPTKNRRISKSIDTIDCHLRIVLYVWILTACRIQNCFHLLTLADQSAESGPAFSMQRGFTLRLRESHCLDFWSEKGCLTHMSLLVLTECCRSMSSQSGKQSQPASIVSLISLKNSWALLALKICFFL